MRLRWGLLALTGLIMAGCGMRSGAQTTMPAPGSSGAALEEPALPGDTQPSSGTPIPEVTPVESESIVLQVWMVADIAPLPDTPGGEVLQSQLDAFDENQPNVRVDIQLKQASGRGSTLDYLRTAPRVAPSVLPDLALLNRSALIEAAREELVVPWDTFEDADDMLAGLDEELYAAAAELGRADGVLVGIPYAVEISHAVYNSETFPREVPRTYKGLLLGTGTPAYVFPAARTGGVNRSTLLQYLATGGRLTDDSGEPILDAAALADVLSFYEEAREEEVLGPRVLQYTTAADTWEVYRQGDAQLAVVNSTAYLAGRAEARDTGLAGIPTAEGTPITLVTGWSWVLTTDDPARQAAALALVAWLMEPTNHGTYTQAAGYLPAQRSALTAWSSDDPYVSFADSLLGVAVIPPPPIIDSTVGVAMQKAVEDVLLGRASAQEAATTAAETVGSVPND